jgi:serine/threonine-protein kinase
MGLDSFASGDRLDNYEITERLGSGGMATVYLGQRQGAAGFSVPVVIKVIHPHLSAEDEFIRMFINEARISSMINHPNVVHVEEFGEEAGLYYLVMEFVDGCSLGSILKANVKAGRRLAPELACAIIAAAARGLHAAHSTTDAHGRELGVVHRDVSPSNILISRAGVVKVIDFGLAKAHGEVGHSKSSAALKGKIRYMSPEQAFGQRLDRRSDIYSLAVVLWELMVNRPLFSAEGELALLEQVRAPLIPPPSSHAAVPVAIDAVIDRATALDPAERFESAADFRRAVIEAMPGAALVDGEQLGAFVKLAGFGFEAPVGSESGGPTVATRADKPATAKGMTPTAQLDPTRSRGKLLAVAAVVAIAAAIIAVVLLRDGESSGGGDQPAQTPAATTEPTEPDAAPVLEPDATVEIEPDAAVPVAEVRPRSKPRPRPKSRPKAKAKARAKAKPKPKSGDDIGISTEFDAPGGGR